MNWKELFHKIHDFFEPEPQPKQRDPETEKYFANYFQQDKIQEKRPARVQPDSTQIPSFARTEQKKPAAKPAAPSSMWKEADEKAQPDSLDFLPVRSAIRSLHENENHSNVQMEADTFLSQEKEFFEKDRDQIQNEAYAKQTMLQAFEWYLPEDGKLWKHLDRDAQALHNIGFTAAWLPPAYKGHGGRSDVGYGVYDLYDLGEFHQKGTVSTKYGTKAQYLKAVDSLQKNRIQVLADIVIDHRMGADETENIRVRSVDGSNRNRITSSVYDATIWSRFTFPGRKGKYSDFVWDASCFNSTDYNARNGAHDIMLFDGKSWNQNVSREFGNYDFVMGLCTDFHEEKVRQELHNWGKWYLNTTHVDGFRLDCLKSIDSSFFAGWIQDLLASSQKKSLQSVGEYWSGNLDELCSYLHQVQFSMSLFDVPLHYHLFDCSRSNGNYDVRKLFDNTLTQRYPDYAVAFVDNHDTQPMQALCSWVEDWFKTSAYACILLKSCKSPCVFYGDLAGIAHSKNPPVTLLEEMLWIRSRILSDEIIDFYDGDSQKACWLAAGYHPVAVLFSIGDKKIRTIRHPALAGAELVNLACPQKSVMASQDGSLELFCYAGCCSIYMLKSDYRIMKQQIHHTHTHRSKLFLH